jgi:tetratricopeptide (TPR) repeat protein
LASLTPAVFSGPLLGAAPPAEKALKLVPTQEGVEYDRPKPDEASACRVVVSKIGAHKGWTVERPDGVTLRRFLDTNGDNVVDQWSYYKDGVEVYRDIDSKFTGKADQFRWLHTAGTRWGVDKDGDGKIDHWKVLSPEEATAEIVAALANRASTRFASALLTPDEVGTLGLGKARAEDLRTRIAKAEAAFKQLAEQQTLVPPQHKFAQFISAGPGLVPAGTDGSTRDLRVYDNVSAAVQSTDKLTHLSIGTLVQVGDTWKAIDAPTPPDEKQAASSGRLFFLVSTSGSAPAQGQGVADTSQKDLAELEKYDPLDPRRVDVLERLAQNARTAEDRAMWYRQIADAVSAAVQTGNSKDGLKRLNSLLQDLRKNNADQALTAYVKFRILTAEHTQKLQSPNADFAKIQSDFNQALEQFIGEYPKAPDAAEAMLQLGIAQEFAGQEAEAKKWYARVAKEFIDSPQAAKAAGATLRLDSVGKSIALSGTSLAGAKVNLADYRGKVVLLQYWATWSEASTKDHATLRKLAERHGPRFTVLGVNLDNDRKELEKYLSKNDLPWIQLHDAGGLDSPPANQLGILTVPAMLLVDQEGKVVNRAVQANDLEGAVKKLLQ